MKTKNKILLTFIALFTIAGVNADYRVYDNMADFEKYEGEVCEAATDGCNNYFMSNGKVMGGTLMACPAEQKIKWTCTKFKDDIVTTTSIIEEASIDNNLSDNDLNFYNTIKDRLDIKYQNAVDKIIYRFDEKLSKYSQVKQNRIKELMVDKIEAKISYVLMQYPQDIALPKKVNDRYLTYTLLKFELMK